MVDAAPAPAAMVCAEPTQHYNHFIALIREFQKTASYAWHIQNYRTVKMRMVTEYVNDQQQDSILILSSNPLNVENVQECPTLGTLDIYDVKYFYYQPFADSNDVCVADIWNDDDTDGTLSEEYRSHFNNRTDVLAYYWDSKRSQITVIIDGHPQYEPKCSTPLTRLTPLDLKIVYVPGMMSPLHYEKISIANGASFGTMGRKVHVDGREYVVTCAHVCPPNTEITVLGNTILCEGDTVSEKDFFSPALLIDRTKFDYAFLPLKHPPDLRIDETKALFCKWDRIYHSKCTPPENGIQGSIEPAIMQTSGARVYKIGATTGYSEGTWIGQAEFNRFGRMDVPIDVSPNWQAVQNNFGENFDTKCLTFVFSREESCDDESLFKVSGHFEGKIVTCKQPRRIVQSLCSKRGTFLVPFCEKGDSGSFVYETQGNKNCVGMITDSIVLLPNLSPTTIALLSPWNMIVEDLKTKNKILT